MISHMLEVKNALEQMVIHLWWMEYIRNLFNKQNGQHAHALIALVRATSLDGDFGHCCQN
jgi:hypothetical protein